MSLNPFFFAITVVFSKCDPMLVTETNVVWLLHKNILPTDPNKKKKKTYIL